MFIRKLKNRSGSISIQIISKSKGKYKVVKTIGSNRTQEGINLLLNQAKHELNNIQKQTSLFLSQEDSKIESFLSTLNNANVRVIGPELVPFKQTKNNRLSISLSGSMLEHRQHLPLYGQTKQ